MRNITLTILPLLILFCIGACHKEKTKDNFKPLAFFTFTPIDGDTTTQYTFNALFSKDQEDNHTQLKAKWDFGDGTAIEEGTLEDVGITQHAYKYIGNYSVNLLITDRGGLSSEWNSVVEVLSFSGNHIPNKPYAPIPDHETLDISTSTDSLFWQASDPDGDTLRFIVYFDTKQSPILYSDTLTIPAMALPPLLPMQHYYWKVKAIDKEGLNITGPEWKFTTGL